MTNMELTEWINEYGKQIYSFCKWLTGCGPEADELYQDTWLVVVQRLDGLEMEGNVKSYCLSVALRLWKNKRRKYARRQRPRLCWKETGQQRSRTGESTRCFRPANKLSWLESRPP